MLSGPSSAQTVRFEVASEAKLADQRREQFAKLRWFPPQEKVTWQKAFTEEAEQLCEALVFYREAFWCPFPGLYFGVRQSNTSTIAVRGKSDLANSQRQYLSCSEEPVEAEQQQNGYVEEAPAPGHCCHGGDLLCPQWPGPCWQRQPPPGPPQPPRCWKLGPQSRDEGG